MATFTTRPVVMGRRGVVTSGHYLATAAGFRILEAGGNAIDSAAAMCFCLNILEPQSNGVGGEVPTLIYSAEEGKAYAVSGMGWSPQAFTVDWCRDNGIDLIPGDGFLAACVPAPVDTWATAVARWGKLSFSEILQPAIELASEGYPVYPGLHEVLRDNVGKFTELYPTTGEVYLPDGVVPEVGTLIRNTDWANMLRVLCKAESGARGGRTAGIEAARDAFYKGEIAQRIVQFMEDNPVEDASGKVHKGLMTLDDMAEWRATVEEPVSYDFGNQTVHKCSSWTQGPVFLQQLALLKGFDLRRMGHNSVEYIHTMVECAKLAFADREAYYGDPLFDDVPFEKLLSESYNEERRDLVSSDASLKMRPGDIGRGFPEYATLPVAEDNQRALGVEASEVKDLGLGHAHVSDTTHLDAIDASGNMVAATPSGGWLGSSPVVKGLGMPMGSRAQMFYLNPDRPNALQPRKRPRATLTPSLVTRDGKPEMVFGTPGGDVQDQITLQFFLNHTVFGMDLQEALDAPTFYSAHFPSSFYPRAAFAGKMLAEGRISEETRKGLEARGHEVDMLEDWDTGKGLGARIDADRGVLSAAASPRRSIGYALGW